MPICVGNADLRSLRKLVSDQGSNFRYSTSHGSKPLGGFLLIRHQAFDSLAVL